jgi:hypothetical protein
MRVVTPALIAILLLANTALAQLPGTYVVPSVPAPRDPLPRFSIAPRGGALAPIGLPLPQLGLPPLASPHQHGRRHGEGAYFYWPVMMFEVAPPVPAPESRPIEQPPAPGRLILDVEPDTAQVFADGYYVGVPDDFGAARGGGLIEAGPHRIDISATGYEPVTLDLRVTAGQSMTYRAVLKPNPPSVSVAPTTFYLIPGCYMGNVPPKDAHLPATCDVARAVTWAR